MVLKSSQVLPLVSKHSSRRSPANEKRGMNIAINSTPDAIKCPARMNSVTSILIRNLWQR
jgi:hypothetical protein